MDNQLNIHFEVDGERAFKIAVLRALETVDLGSTEQNLISAKPEEFGDLAAKLYTAKFAETLALLIKEEVSLPLFWRNLFGVDVFYGLVESGTRRRCLLCLDLASMLNG